MATDDATIDCHLFAAQPLCEKRVEGGGNYDLPGPLLSHFPLACGAVGSSMGGIFTLSLRNNPNL